MRDLLQNGPLLLPDRRTTVPGLAAKAAEELIRLIRLEGVSESSARTASLSGRLQM